ncbi:MAG: ABC transporter ATP-binding protein [Planctomycetota bacterium]
MTATPSDTPSHEDGRVLPAIEVRDISKVYKIYQKPLDRLREQMPWNNEKRHRELHALKNVSFEVQPGSCVGVIGGNGAGKSTLLKILTGTTFPSAGSYTVRGRVAALLELGTGFQRHASGRSNIFTNAAMLGRSSEETAEKFQEILDFSELHDFIDQPVGTYSSGMIARLGFSVAVATEPDVLIIDEILAVGDMHFRKKCVDKIMSFREQGKTMFFCSHSLYDVRQLCDLTLWMKMGEMQMFTDSVSVTNEYATYENQLIEKMAEDNEALRLSHANPIKSVDLDAMPRVVSVDLVDGVTGEKRHEFAPFESVAVRVHLRNGREPVGMNLVVGFTRADGTLCFAPASHMDEQVLDFQEGVVTLKLPDLRLLSGEFVVPVWLLDDNGVHRYHEVAASQNLIVKNRTKELGLYHTDREWEIEVLEQAGERDGEPSEA